MFSRNAQIQSHSKQSGHMMFRMTRNFPPSSQARIFRYHELTGAAARCIGNITTSDFTHHFHGDILIYYLYNLFVWLDSGNDYRITESHHDWLYCPHQSPSFSILCCLSSERSLDFFLTLVLWWPVTQLPNMETYFYFLPSLNMAISTQLFLT